MAIDFVSPSMRASGSDLSIQMSPLGLVELSDEEFEVHGPRLNRYAFNWAMYLGHHWSYVREDIETQITANYTRAFSDYLTNFTFAKGIHFQSAKQFQHIVPSLLDRIWGVDNDKMKVLWEIGNQGSVSGDVFVKVAYEPAFVNDAGIEQAGRVRILPLNPANCFPEWHPHDRGRMTRFKLKYRFWATAPDGTRQVFTYVEVITEDMIIEYVNDQQIDARPNPLGTIPVVHIANVPVSSSPWGLSDIQDVALLNRNYNETLSEVSEIIKYHAAPITIVTGAKVSQLEKGASKVWAGLDKDSKVFNLEGGAAGLPAAMEFLALLKRQMHELSGVPENALGETQAISNTSGVALIVQYLPLMQKYDQKKMQYESGIREICSIALRTLFLFEPDALFYNPETEGIWQDGMPFVLDPTDPLIYRVDITWPQPLPVDQLIKLNEIQVKMLLGIESKVGALRELGEEFPDEKLQELFDEQMEDIKREAAMALYKSHVQSFMMQETGIAPDGTAVEPDGTPKVAAKPTNADGSPAQPDHSPAKDMSGMVDMSAINDPAQTFTEINTMAFGAKQGKRRDPSNGPDSTP